MLKETAFYSIVGKMILAPDHDECQNWNESRC